MCIRDSAGAEVALTPSEYAICEFLARHPGQVFSRDQIAESAFGWDVSAKGASVPVHVGNLRAKFKERGVDPVSYTHLLAVRSFFDALQALPIEADRIDALRRDGVVDATFAAARIAAGCAAVRLSLIHI